MHLRLRPILQDAVRNGRQQRRVTCRAIIKRVWEISAGAGLSVIHFRDPIPVRRIAYLCGTQTLILYPMKKTRLLSSYACLMLLVMLVTFSSCTPSRQVFYFQPAPASPKISRPLPERQPVYTASTDAFPLVDKQAGREEIKTEAITKKELRKLLKQQVRMWKDTVPNKSNNRKVTVTGDKQKLENLKTEVQDLKKSVKVERSDDKVVVNYQQPANELSDTTKILLAVAALVILIALFSIPVIGPLLAAILAVAVVAGALALILGYVEIRGN